MRKFEEMRQLLDQVKSNDYAVPAGVDLDDAIADMLRFVGDIDSDLRENVYSTFDTWSDKGMLSPEQMRHILNIAMDGQHLFLGIGESGTDSVFTRSFTSLLISVAFCMQDEHPFMTSAEIQAVKEAVLRYVRQEQDYRGYVKGKGWAHAVAHIADALANLACIDKATDVDSEYTIGRDGMLEILEAIKILAINSEKVYDTAEDERLAVAVMYVFGQEVLSEDDMRGWLASLGEAIERKAMPADYYRRINQKHFMRSLYFRMLAVSELEGLSKFLLEILKNLSSLYREA